jgi:DnaJ-class molecular chaperone
MTPARYARILEIRERYNDLMAGAENTIIPIEKTELLDLMQASLERGDIEVQFNASFSKMTPKLKADGSKSIEFTFVAPFSEALLANAGQAYGSGVHLSLEENVVADPVKREEPRSDDADPEGLNMELPFDGETPEAKDEGAAAMRLKATCAACGGLGYRGEGSEESCEDCGGTGVVFTESKAPETMPCPDCGGSGNVADEEGTLGPCLTCHSTGKVELVAEEVADQEQTSEDDEPHASEGEPAGDVDPASIF